MKGKEYKTLYWYQKANEKAHDTLIKHPDYNSEMYASKEGVLTVNGTYLLLLIPKFEKYLNEVNLYFTEFKISYIKKNEIII